MSIISEDKTVAQDAPDFPSHLDIELTNHCNLRCVMCPRDKMTRPKGYIDAALFARILEEAGNNNLQTAWLHLYGEPLLHPAFADLITIAKEKAPKAQIGLSTNCTFLDERATAAILKSGLTRIILSVDGFTQETYEKVRPPARFEEVLKNVKYFLHARERAGSSVPSVVLQLIRMKDTEVEAETFLDLWKPLLGRGDTVSVKPFDTFAGSVSDGAADENENRRRLKPCPQLWSRGPSVLWDGRVTFCCYDYDGKYLVGDLADSTLKEIWHNERYSRLRHIHAKLDFTELSMCSRCFSFIQDCAV